MRSSTQQNYPACAELKLEARTPELPEPAQPKELQGQDGFHYPLGKQFGNHGRLRDQPQCVFIPTNVLPDLLMAAHSAACYHQQEQS